MRTVALCASLLLVLFVQFQLPTAGTMPHFHELSQQPLGISITIDFGNQTNTSYVGISATNVLNATQSIAQVGLKWYGDLAFVTSIDGIPNDPVGGLWWQYWVNEQLGSVAANKYQLQDNDSIQWRRELSHFNADDGGQLDYSLLLGASILGLFALVFLGVLCRRKPRG